jgi:hypothetical protein
MDPYDLPLGDESDRDLVFQIAGLSAACHVLLAWYYQMNLSWDGLVTSFI